MHKSKSKETVCFVASVRELGASEVSRKLGQTYKHIKAKDAHPVFVELEVAEEGFSSGELETLPGVYQNVKKWWSGNIIRELVDSMKPFGKQIGKLFKGHTPYSDPEGKNAPTYGDILHAETIERNGKTVAKAIAYVEPGEIRDGILSGKYNTCSIQAAVNFVYDGARWVAKKVYDFYGVALADGRVDTPGFATAGVVSVVRELEAKYVRETEDDDEEEEDTDAAHGGRRRKGAGYGRRKSMLDIDEVRLWLSKNAIPPEKLYQTEELLKFPVVKGALDNAKEEGLGEAEAKTEELKKAQDAALKEWQDKLKLVETERDGLKSQVKPLEEQRQREQLDKVIRNAALMKDATEKEAKFIIDQIPVALMQEQDVDKRGKAIEDAIKTAKDKMVAWGVSFESKDAGASGAAGAGSGEARKSSAPEADSPNPLSHNFKVK